MKLETAALCFNILTLVAGTEEASAKDKMNVISEFVIANVPNAEDWFGFSEEFVQDVEDEPKLDVLMVRYLRELLVTGTPEDRVALLDYCVLLLLQNETIPKAKRDMVNLIAKFMGRDMAAYDKVLNGKDWTIDGLLSA